MALVMDEIEPALLPPKTSPILGTTCADFNADGLTECVLPKQCFTYNLQVWIFACNCLLSYLLLLTLMINHCSCFVLPPPNNGTFGIVYASNEVMSTIGST